MVSDRDLAVLEEYQRLESWMRAKHRKGVWVNLMQRVRRANDRGAQRVTVPTAVLEELLDLAKEAFNA